MEIVNTVGRRKAAVARVFVKPGNGQITINRKALEVYFPLDILQFQVKQPLLATNTAENYDIVINLDGGGIKGQAEAARLGIARALCEIDAEMRPTLKKAGFLTRDPREVERKKRVSRAHAASSSSVSVNLTGRIFGHARRGFQIRKTTYNICLLADCPVAENSAGSVRTSTGELTERELKLKKTNQNVTYRF